MAINRRIKNFGALVFFVAVLSACSGGSSLTSVGSGEPNVNNLSSTTSPISISVVMPLIDYVGYVGDPLEWGFTINSDKPEELAIFWYKDGQPLPAARLSNLQFTALAAEDAGKYSYTVYRQLVDRELTYLVSGEALLEVRPASEKPAIPAFISVSGNLQVARGEPAKLMAIASSNPLPTMTWFKDGVMIPNQNSYKIEIAATDLGHAGLYHAVATNANGSTSSAAIKLLVTGETCELPDQRVTIVGEIVQTGCLAKAPVTCVPDEFAEGEDKAFGEQHTYACGTGGLLETTTVVCIYDEDRCDDGEFED